MSADIQERICKIIAEQLSQDADEVVPEASFIDDLEQTLLIWSSS